jgi:hypothetical protein
MTRSRSVIEDTVRFTVPNGTYQCRIEERWQTFVRCARDPVVQGTDYWINVPAMIGVEVKATR